VPVTARRLVGMEVVRQALRAAVERDGLRPVARAVGMTPTGLSKALETSLSPRSSTQTKMRDWYVRHGRAIGPSTYSARIALEMMLEGLPEPHRADGIAQMLQLIERIYRNSGVHPPEWLRKLIG
jgi:hypothetical protein